MARRDEVVMNIHPERGGTRRLCEEIGKAAHGRTGGCSERLGDETPARPR